MRASASLATEPRVRRAQPGEGAAVAALLHQSAVDMYDRFAGGRERALRMLRRAFDGRPNAASADAVWVVELDGRLAGAMAGFPVAEAAKRSRAFLRLALTGSPPWRWPLVLRLFWVGGRASPGPPARAFYVDALATDPSLRRRGGARALLAEAERQARARGLEAVALDTTLGNRAARALYRSTGFAEVGSRPPAHGLPGFVALVKRLD